MSSYYDWHDAEFDTDVPGVTKRYVPQKFSSSHPLGDPAWADQFLDQNESWASKDGYVKIADMEPSHALNAARFVLDRSLDVMLTLHVSGRPASAMGTGVRADAVIDEYIARRYVMKTPLVTALLARAAIVEASVPPWAATPKK